MKLSRPEAAVRQCMGVLFAVLLGVAPGALAQQQKLPADDLPADFKAPVQESDFVKRVAMIPMRDGTKLYTVIVVAKGAKDAPILLTRTCYNAAARERGPRAAA